MELKIHIDKVFTLISQQELMILDQFFIGGLLALLFGYIIGWERKKHDKPAGIVTHSFVILGSMVFTILSSVMTGGDPTRIAAAVVQGVGFLGAGMILKGEEGVENLTTAAGMWVSAAVGMALGFKMYLIASTIVLMMFCARFLPRVKK